MNALWAAGQFNNILYFVDGESLCLNLQDGGEEFLSVQIVPLNSHIALLVGGNFCEGNGR